MAKKNPENFKPINMLLPLCSTVPYVPNCVNFFFLENAYGNVFVTTA